MMVVVGRRDGNHCRLVALSSLWRWFGGGTDEGTVNVDVVSSSSWWWWLGGGMEDNER